MKQRFSVRDLEDAVEAERAARQEAERQTFVRGVYTHLIPCASFVKAMSTPGRVWGLLLRDWHILLLDRGQTYRTRRDEGLARQFPGAPYVFIFHTGEDLPDEARWGLMDLLDVQRAIFNWVQP